MLLYSTLGRTKKCEQKMLYSHVQKCIVTSMTRRRCIRFICICTILIFRFDFRHDALLKHKKKIYASYINLLGQRVVTNKTTIIVNISFCFYEFIVIFKLFSINIPFLFFKKENNFASRSRMVKGGECSRFH